MDRQKFIDRFNNLLIEHENFNDFFTARDEEIERLDKTSTDIIKQNPDTGNYKIVGVQYAEEHKYTIDNELKINPEFKNWYEKSLQLFEDLVNLNVEINESEKSDIINAIISDEFDIETCSNHVFVLLMVRKLLKGGCLYPTKRNKNEMDQYWTNWATFAAKYYFPTISI